MKNKYFIKTALETNQSPENIMISGKTLYCKVPVTYKEYKSYVKCVEKIRIGRK